MTLSTSGSHTQKSHNIYYGIFLCAPKDERSQRLEPSMSPYQRHVAPQTSLTPRVADDAETPVPRNRVRVGAVVMIVPAVRIASVWQSRFGLPRTIPLPEPDDRLALQDVERHGLVRAMCPGEPARTSGAHQQELPAPAPQRRMTPKSLSHRITDVASIWIAKRFQRQGDVRLDVRADAPVLDRTSRPCETERNRAEDTSCFQAAPPVFSCLSGSCP